MCCLVIYVLNIKVHPTVYPSSTEVKVLVNVSEAKIENYTTSIMEDLGFRNEVHTKLYCEILHI